MLFLQKPNKEAGMNLKISIQVSKALAGMRTQGLSDKTGIATTSINEMMRRGTCHTGTLEKLAAAFDIKVSEFIARGE